jgi:hypothetical protein
MNCGKAYTVARVAPGYGEAVCFSDPLCAPDEPGFLESCDDLTIAVRSHVENC